MSQTVSTNRFCGLFAIAPGSAVARSSSVTSRHCSFYRSILYLIIGLDRFRMYSIKPNLNMIRRVVNAVPPVSSLLGQNIRPRCGYTTRRYQGEVLTITLGLQVDCLRKPELNLVTEDY